VSETHLVALRDVFCVHRTNEGDAAALQGTTLHVRRGELICVLGPSGAGKSTLLRVIAGLQVPSAGEVIVLGRDMGRLPARVRARVRHLRIGFLGQSSQSLFSPDLRVSEALSLPLALRGVKYRPIGAAPLLRRNLLIYGIGGIIIPFIFIKAIDLVLQVLHLTL